MNALMIAHIANNAASGSSSNDAFVATLGFFTALAATITAVFNLIAIFVRGKVDPSALRVIDRMAKDYAATSRLQADKIDNLTRSVTTEMHKLGLVVTQVATKMDSALRK